MQQFKPLVAVTIGAFALCACSTSSYQKPTSELSAGISTAEAAFVTLAETERTSFISSQVRVGLAAGNSITISENCGPLILDRDGKPATKVDCTPILTKHGVDKPMTYDPAAPNAVELATAVDDYGKALLKIAEAKDIADLKDASAKAAAAATTLATTFGGPGIGAVAGAGLGIVNWLVGAYLDYQRFQDMRSIVNDADPSIEIAHSKLSAIAKLMQESVVTKRSVDIRFETTALAHLRQSTTDRAKLQAAGEQLVSDALALQAFANTDVAKPFAKMRKAHAELRESLNNPKVDPGAAFAAISDFGKSVDAMNTAVKKLKTTK